MSLLLITYNGVLELLKDVKAHSAGRHHAIPTSVLHACCDAIAYFLVVLFDKSLNSGSLRQDWKLANVTPVHKGGARNFPLNYKLTSLTSICCKVLEHFIALSSGIENVIATAQSVSIGFDLVYLIQRSS